MWLKQPELTLLKELQLSKQVCICTIYVFYLKKYAIEGLKCTV